MSKTRMLIGGMWVVPEKRERWGNLCRIPFPVPSLGVDAGFPGPGTRAELLVLRVVVDVSQVRHDSPNPTAVIIVGSIQVSKALF